MNLDARLPLPSTPSLPRPPRKRPTALRHMRRACVARFDAIENYAPGNLLVREAWERARPGAWLKQAIGEGPFRVLAALVDEIHPTSGNCVVTRAELALHAGVSVRTVARALSKLAQEGVLFKRPCLAGIAFWVLVTGSPEEGQSRKNLRGEPLAFGTGTRAYPRCPEAVARAKQLAAKAAACSWPVVEEPTGALRYPETDAERLLRPPPPPTPFPLPVDPWEIVNDVHTQSRLSLIHLDKLDLFFTTNVAHRRSEVLDRDLRSRSEADPDQRRCAKCRQSHKANSQSSSNVCTAKSELFETTTEIQGEGSLPGNETGNLSSEQAASPLAPPAASSPCLAARRRPRPSRRASLPARVRRRPMSETEIDNAWRRWQEQVKGRQERGEPIWQDAPPVPEAPPAPAPSAEAVLDDRPDLPSNVAEKKASVYDDMDWGLE